MEYRAKRFKHIFWNYLNGNASFKFLSSPILTTADHPRQILRITNYSHHFPSALFALEYWNIRCWLFLFRTFPYESFIRPPVHDRACQSRRRSVGQTYLQTLDFKGQGILFNKQSLGIHWIVSAAESAGESVGKRRQIVSINVSSLQNFCIFGILSLLQIT